MLPHHRPYNYEYRARQRERERELAETMRRYYALTRERLVCKIHCGFTNWVRGSVFTLCLPGRIFRSSAINIGEINLNLWCNQH